MILAGIPPVGRDADGGLQVSCSAAGSPNHHTMTGWSFSLPPKKIVVFTPFGFRVKIDGSNLKQSNTKSTSTQHNASLEKIEVVTFYKAAHV